MKDNKYRLCKDGEGAGHFYLEMNDLTEAAIQIWESSDGEKKTFVRIKISDSDLENIISEYNRIQALQKTNK
jgi:hypothetical protein